jgi:hypothetical protein
VLPHGNDPRTAVCPYSFSFDKIRSLLPSSESRKQIPSDS